MTDDDNNPFLNKAYRQSAWKQIMERIEEEEKVKTIRPWYLYGAAAVLILAIGLLILYTADQKNTSAAVVVARYIKMVNTHPDPSLVVLEDGSKITLYPNAEIIYRQTFDSVGRQVYLKGKAFFDVTPDKKRPFAVQAGNIRTTALGTSFTILSDSLPNTVNVFLHTGKVMVQRSDKQEMVYLLPGQHVNYTITGSLPIVQQFQSIGKPAVTVKKVKKEGMTTPAEYQFEQEPLVRVLQKLSSGFHIHLNYYPEELNNLYFSGKIRSTDKPIYVLERIAALHDLTVTADRKGFSIRKN